MKTIKEIAPAYSDYAVAMRRTFHQHPEASMQETWTCAKICQELRDMGIRHQVVAGTGVVATLGRGDGKTVMLRADMDALTVTEETGLDFCSQQPGMMHACGHDGHMAMLLTAAKLLQEVEEQLAGTVKLFFQPGEEVGLGAKAMIAAGALEGVDGCFGIHLWSDIPTGKISVEAGPRMASADRFELTITGKSGHGSMPHQGADAVLAAAAVVMNLQQIASRRTDPLESAVVTVGTVEGGSRWNVLAGETKLTGTTRTFSGEICRDFPAMIEQIATSTATAYGATARLDYTPLLGPTVNDETCSAIAADAVRALCGEKALYHFERITGGEDFSYYLQEVPGCLAFVGIRSEEKGSTYPHHHEKFQMDEDALITGAALYAQFAVDFLAKF